MQPGRKLVGLSPALLVLELAFLWLESGCESGRRPAGKIISGLALAVAWARPLGSCLASAGRRLGARIFSLAGAWLLPGFFLAVFAGAWLVPWPTPPAAPWPEPGWSLAGAWLESGFAWLLLAFPGLSLASAGMSLAKLASPGCKFKHLRCKYP